MLDLFIIISIISELFAAKEIIKEKAEKPAPKGTRFDWDTYWNDIEGGIGAIEQLKKQQHGEYYTTKPPAKRWYELPMDTVIDTKRYEHDKTAYGEAIAEMWRKNGSYRQIRGF